MKQCRKLPVALTIAGSDSGGGAGIQTDLRTFNAFRVYGCSAITAVTSQNPFEVRRVDALPAAAVRCQIESVLDAFPVRIAKTGMLANREIVECVAETVSERSIDLVVDPVMVSTSGIPLLEESAVAVMMERLFPLAAWITPNIPEAELICGQKITSADDLADAAMTIYRRFGCSVILKSGHLDNVDSVSDIVCHEGKLFAATSPRIAVFGNVAHGTGCTLSAALAANLARGENWECAVREAKAFVFGALAEKVFLSDTLCQMYPPEESALFRITLDGYDS